MESVNLATIKSAVALSKSPDAMREFNRLIKFINGRVEFADEDRDARYVVLEYNENKTTVRCSRPLRLDDAEAMMDDDSRRRQGYKYKKVKL